MEIIGEILTTAKEGVHQEELKKRTNISPQMLNKYTERLIITQKLNVHKEGNKYMYNTTKAGNRTLEVIQRINRSTKRLKKNLAL